VGNLLIRYEDPNQRAAPDERVGEIFYRRIYLLPKEAFDLVPAWGSLALVGQQLRADDHMRFPYDTDATALQAPRFMQFYQSDKESKTGFMFRAVIYQPILLAGATNELRGSPSFSPSATRKAGIREFVSLDGFTGVPVRGDIFPGDSALVGGRVALPPSLDTKTYPGLYHSIVTYQGYEPFVSAI
jgi:hypothetical protein